MSEFILLNLPFLKLLHFDKNSIKNKIKTLLLRMRDSLAFFDLSKKTGESGG